MLSPTRTSSVHGRVFATLLLTTIFMTVMAVPVLADQNESGKVIGKIVDSETGEALLGVSIYVEGTSQGAISDLDGNYLIKNLAPGQYTLVAKAIGYTTVTITEVAVAGGEQTKINFSMSEEAVEVEGIKVTAKEVKNSQAAMLKHRQAAKTVTDAISSEQMSKSGSGDAAEAMSKVVGATVTEGKYIYVRGLGDRYANTQLNGSLLPTSDPDKQAVPMDMIPTGLLDNIIVTKTFTPDKPGNFSGGSVDLVTRDFPESQVISVSTSAGYNTQSTGNDDFLTYDAGDRLIPGMWNTPEAAALGNDWRGFTRSQDTAQFVNELANSFNKSIRQSTKTGPANGSISASYGNQFQLFNRPLGVTGSFTYNRSFKFYDDGIEGKYKVSTSSGSQDLLLQHYLHDRMSSEEELYGGLGSINYSLAKNHKVGFTYVRNQTYETDARYLEGGAPTTFSFTMEDTTSARLEARVLEYNERKLTSLQFNGEHQVEAGLQLKLDWRASFSEAEQNTPDLRFFNNKVSTWGYDRDGEWVEFDQPVYTIDATDIDILPTRYFRDVKESNDEFSANLQIPFTRDIKLKTGLSALKKDRSHAERRFVYDRNGEFSGDPQEYYNSVGYDSLIQGSTVIYTFNNFINEATTPNVQYTGEQKIRGYYGMLEVHPFRALTVIAGARYETTDMSVENGYDTTAENYISGYASGTINEDDLLPSLNMIYALSSNMNFRAAYGRTLARPTLREFAPYASDDFGGSGKKYNGNPHLERTLIHNHDLRWELFYRPGEVVAISLFHKKFDKPIELAILDANENNIGPRNIDEASLYGAEFEVRKRLDDLGQFFKYFDLSGNLTIVESKVDIPEEELIQQRAYDPNADDTRQMFGQSPYVVNLGIGYDNPRRGFTLNVHWNRVGKRFAVNAPGGTPDIYERARSMVDVIASQRLFWGLTIKATARNILDTRHVEAYDSEYEEAIFRSYGSGRSFSLGLSYKFE